ncbi:MAG: hypothetical protein GY703_13555, partial [Gammaproteobacteria bacterium]|nr:hypothetical protein [Gammaproteobacteria bacterium]
GGENEVITFSYEVVEKDDGGTELSRTPTTAQITITGANDDATISGVTSSASEDAVGYILNLLSNSSDPDGSDLLSVESVSPVSGDASGVTYNDDGTFTVNPGLYNALAVGESEVITFNYEVVEKDDGGTELSRTPTTAQITITGAIDDATISGVTSSAGEDNPGYTVDLLSNSAQSDASNVLSVETVSLLSGDASGITDNGNGTFSVDPGAYNALAVGENQVITYNYEVVEKDDGGTELSRTPTTVQITITGANDGATVAGVTSSTSEDESVYSLNLLSNSSDPDGSDTLSVSNLSLISGNAIGVTDNSDGTITVNPDAYNYLARGESEVVIFGYDVSDGKTSSSTTVSLTISGVNDTPVVGAIVSNATEDAVDYTIDLLSNSSDADTSDSLSVSNLSLVNGNAAGITNSGDGTLSINPNAYNNLAQGESEVVTYRYDVSDGTVARSTTVTLTITGENDTPVFVSSGGAGTVTIEVGENTTLVDDLHALDADNDSLSYRIVGGADQSLFNIDSESGIVTFVQSQNFEQPADVNHDGVYEVMVMAVDDKGGEAVQRLNLRLVDHNEAPAGVTFASSEVSNAPDSDGGHQVGELSSIDEDIGDVVSFSIVGGSDQSSFRIANGSHLVVDAARLENSADGTFDLVIRMTDSQGLSSDVPLSIKVEKDTRVGDAPPPGWSDDPRVELIIGLVERSEVPDKELDRSDTKLETKEEPGAESSLDEAFAELSDEVTYFEGSTPEPPVSYGSSLSGTVSVDLDSLNRMLLGARKTAISPAAAMGLLAIPSEAVSTYTLEFASQEQMRLILNDLKQEVEQRNQVDSIVVGSGVFTSTSLSVGYAVWLIRGGALASTVLSSLPAWQFLDPLPVLARVESGKDKDDESLESIIKKQRQTTDNKEYASTVPA